MSVRPSLQLCRCERVSLPRGAHHLLPGTPMSDSITGRSPWNSGNRRAAAGSVQPHVPCAGLAVPRVASPPPTLPHGVFASDPCESDTLITQGGSGLVTWPSCLGRSFDREPWRCGVLTRVFPEDASDGGAPASLGEFCFSCLSSTSRMCL